MTKVKFFREEYQQDLAKEINDFIRNKKIINISYSTNTVGYSVYHYCCVLYVE